MSATFNKIIRSWERKSRKNIRKNLLIKLKRHWSKGSTNSKAYTPLEMESKNSS
jgi:hypothetical protein